MRAASILVSLLVVAGCTDQFTETYSTLEVARRDRIFERGWLPDVLPTSARTLRVSGDVDINTAEGEFSFRGAEFDAFIAKLQAVPVSEPIPDHIVERTGELQREGYTERAYVHEQYMWIFLCSRERERCEYHGWPMR